MAVPPLDPARVGELYDRSGAARWNIEPQRFRSVLDRSIGKLFPGDVGGVAVVMKAVRSLHLEDLVLAAACEDGHEGAWDHFVREFRPQLYRAATAIDPAGGGRELADALYADLFGLTERDGVRQSLFRYFHGRSSLATWLRAVLSQRHVDNVRRNRGLEPLPEDGEAPLSGSRTRAHATGAMTPALDRPRHTAAVIAALVAAIGQLIARDRLRLSCYHAQNLTLAQIGRLTGEHEATVSRHLTRTRRDLRRAVEERLRNEHGMADAEIAESLSEAVEDSGILDVNVILDAAVARKDAAPGRSIGGTT